MSRAEAWNDVLHRFLTEVDAPFPDPDWPDLDLLYALDTICKSENSA